MNFEVTQKSYYLKTNIAELMQIILLVSQLLKYLIFVDIKGFLAVLYFLISLILI